MNWSQVSLASVCDKPQYGAIAKGSHQQIGPRFVRQTDIVLGRIDWSTVPYCDLSPSDFNKYSLRRGDLLISRLGNGVGNAAIVKNANDAVFAGYLVRFRTLASKADPDFVGYQLQSDAWRQHVVGFRSGAAQPTLNAQQMGEFKFLLPPLHEQAAIAATLGALDDKIESNRRLRQIVWDLLAAEYNQLAVGSAVVEIRELLGLEYGRSLSADKRMPGKVPVYGSNGITGYHDRELIPGPGIILGRKGSIGEVHWTHGASFPIDTTFYVSPRSGYPLLACYFALKSAGLRNKNSDSAIPGLNRDTALGVRVPAPPISVARAWSERREVLLDYVDHLEDESAGLASLRDALLPELLSGRLRVPEADEVLV